MSNAIKKIEDMDSLSSLESLDLRSNELERLDGFSENLGEITPLNFVSLITLVIVNLKSIDLTENMIESFEEIGKLRVLPALESLIIEGCVAFFAVFISCNKRSTANPVADLDDYRLEVRIVLPSLKEVDGEPFTVDEMEEAVIETQHRKEEAERAAAEEGNTPFTANLLALSTKPSATPKGGRRGTQAHRARRKGRS